MISAGRGAAVLGAHTQENEFGSPARESTERSVNIESCAICDAFAKCDAPDLVRYMCATDDVMSDRGNQGSGAPDQPDHGVTSIVGSGLGYRMYWT